MTQINDHAEWPKIYLSDYAEHPNRVHPDPEVPGALLTVMFSPGCGAWPRDVVGTSDVSEPSWASWLSYSSLRATEYTRPESQLPYALGLKYLAKYRNVVGAEHLLPDWFRQQLEEAARDQNQ